MKDLTDEENKAFNLAKFCHICGNEFNSNSEKVKVHDHLNVKYRGPAHKIYNVNYRLSNYVTVIAHNLFGYDIQLFLEELCKTSEDIILFGKPTEKFLIFTNNDVYLFES
jgi:hypothetical protein